MHQSLRACYVNRGDGRHTEVPGKCELRHIRPVLMANGHSFRRCPTADPQWTHSEPTVEMDSASVYSAAAKPEA